MSVGVEHGLLRVVQDMDHGVGHELCRTRTMYVDVGHGSCQLV